METVHAVRQILANAWKSYLKIVYGGPEGRTIFAPDYLHLLSLRRFVKRELSSLKEGQIILDVGCGDQRYKRFISKGVTYIGMDYVPTRNMFYSQMPVPEILGDAQAIPCRDESFDFVLCTQVLEHVADFSLALREMVRVLKPDGKLIITVPFVFPEHNTPFDYVRFTMHGIKQKCEETGLKVLVARRVGGAGTALVDTLTRMLTELLRSTRIGKCIYYSPGLLVLPLIWLLLNIVGEIINKLPLNSFYANTGLLCRKVELRGEKREDGTKKV